MKNSKFFTLLVLALIALSIQANAVMGKQSVETLKKLARKIPSSTGEQFALKLAYQRKGDKFVIHYINTNQYSYHIEFVQQDLKQNVTDSVFNKNYNGPLKNRSFVLATLALSQAKADGPVDLALFELWSGDTLDGLGIQTTLDLLRAELPKELKLKFHPLSIAQEKLAKQVLKPELVVYTKDLIGDRDFVALNEGEAVGYLRFYNLPKDGEAEIAVDMKTIAVFDQVPNDIGLCGGVITAEPQTPLSHVNVKAINRRTINLFLKNAKETLKAYENKPVRLKVTSGGYKIEEFRSPEQAEQAIKNFWSSRRPSPLKLESPKLDPALNSQFVDMTRFYKSLPNRNIHSKLIRTVGAKAANIALLHAMVKRIPGEQVMIPEALGIPFNFYEMFINLKQKGLDPSSPERETTPRLRSEEILRKAGLLNTKVLVDAEKAAPVLKEVRDMTAKAQVPQQMLQIFKKLILEDKNSPIYIDKHPRIRLRSSTNSEDLEGFSGAGLYDSDGINLYKKLSNDKGYDRHSPKAWEKIEKDLKEAIAFLYSGVWNDRAFFEREWYSINGLQHFNVKMGLALHGAFPRYDFDGKDGEVANGVSVTTNIYKPEEEGKVYINSQHFDLAVTNPPAAKDLIEAGEDPEAPYSTEELVVTTFLADPSDDAKPEAWTRWSIERVRSTSVQKGADVLKISPEGTKGGDETRRLAKAMEALSRTMARVYEKDQFEFDVDVEWKLYGPERTLIIKQIRPFLAPGEEVNSAIANGAGRAAFAPMPPAQKRSLKLQSGPQPPRRYDQTETSLD